MSTADDRLARRTNLSPERRALLEKLLQGGSAGGARAIPRRPHDGPAPLSPGQERLWFLDQLMPGTATYNMPFALRLTGRLDVIALERSLAEIVRRHQALRTTFAAVDGRPLQLIEPAGPLPLPIVDLRGVPIGAREAAARQMAAEEARRPFDLTRGPLLRAGLLRLDEAEHVLLLTMHHIVSDAWSLGILIRELDALYGAFAAGRPSPLSELPLQYADFAHWQRERAQGATVETQLAYWRQQLAGAPALLELPTDRPRPPVQSYHGARHFLTLSEPLLEAVKTLSQREGVTPFMTLLAAFQALLFRYSGQQDLVVGTPIANRGRPEVEGLIGFFVNTLALRTSLAGNLTFRELLGRVREVTLEAFAHQDLPFERLVEAIQPDRDLSRTPLFQVMFVFQNAPQPTVELPGLSMNLIDQDSGTAQVDLTLELFGTQGCLEYNTDLFDPDTIARLAGHFETLLSAAVAEPGRPILDLPLLTRPERHQLAAWNATDVAYPADRCLHELIEAQVERTPDVVAVAFEGEQLSYRELNERANRLAHYLRGLGVGPDERVGVCMERSLELVVGLLGVLKAGGAYVPLDPSYPRERLAFMLEDACAPVLLTQQRLLPLLDGQRATVVCLDVDGEAMATASPENPAQRVTADDLAYVIFTSGSTGRPKGAMNTHRAICNRLLWMQDAYRLSADDRVLQKTPFSFDVSVWEFFWPLMTGARLVVARPGGHQDSAYLVDLIRREGITTLHFVPSMLQIFLEQPGLERLTGLRRVICSGEALPFELQERFFARLGAELHNLYGPTEAAVDVTFWACEREGSRRIVPIGHPIANTQIHILDARGRPVPVGVPGELYIGGVNLARGYLGRPDLTAEKFVTDPLADSPGARLYRTGDLARRLPDGAVEYLGRLDHQVKIRGFRIELGEIEAVLGQHRSVRDCAVVARDDGPGGPRLIAYVVPVEPSALPTEALRAFLKEQLPDYMIPSAFVGLEALPLSPNGKLERRALPSPELARPEIEAAYVAPRTDAERTVAAIWQEVLGLARVGLEDNFFDLGGHSLLLARVQAELRSRLEARLSMVDLFKYPTVRSLARALDGAEPAAAPPGRILDRAALQRQAINRQKELARQRTGPVSGRPQRPG